MERKFHFISIFSISSGLATAKIVVFADFTALRFDSPMEFSLHKRQVTGSASCILTRHLVVEHKARRYLPLECHLQGN
jgi:hypothetical protein